MLWSSSTLVVLLSCSILFSTTISLTREERIAISQEKAAVAQRELDVKIAEWSNYTEYARISNPATREEQLKQALTQISGIYKDKTRLEHYPRLINTVLVHVIEISDEKNHEKYTTMLKNMLCFEQHHQLRSMVYILDSVDSTNR